MRALTPVEIMDAWEIGSSLAPVERALALLSISTGRSEVEVATDTIAARDAALLGLRIALLGETIDCVASCPECAETVELSVDAGELLAPGDPGAVLVHHDGYHVRCRVPSTEDVLVAAAARDTRNVLLRRCVLDARKDGAAVSAEALPAAALDAIDDALAAADPSDVELVLSCPACGHRWPSRFDVGSILWSEIDGIARRLAADVHTLASAYGWSETEILALRPARRRLYVEVVSR